MSQESRLVIRVDSKLSEQQVKELDKALMLLERTGLSVTRTAKTTSAQIAELGRESEAATRSIDRATAVWAKFNSVVAMAGVGLSAVGAVSMFKSVAENVESLRLFSEQIGITTEQLSSLRYAADDMAGVSSRTLDPALRRMTRRIQEAANESGPAANALKMLRLEAKALSELDVESQLYAVADAMKALPNHADKLRATMAIFDTEGMPLVNMLNQGAEAIREAQQEAELLGQTISQLDAERVGQLNSELAKVTARFDSIKTQAALNMLPAVEGLSAALGVTAEHFDTLAKVTGGVALVALSRYTGGLVEARVETVKGILERRKAVRAELELARAQKAQTAETLRQTLAMDAQNVTRAQVQAAVQADIAAKKRLEMAEAALTRQVTASTAAMRLARNALGLVGGPFGALTLAVTAGAAAWYDHKAKVEENRRVFEDLKTPLDEVIEKYKKLTELQKKAFINKDKEALEQALKDEKKAWDELANAIFDGTYAMGGVYDENTQELLKFRAALEEVRKAGADITPIINEIGNTPLFGEKRRREVENLGAKLEETRETVKALQGRIQALRNEEGHLSKGLGEGISKLNDSAQGLSDADFSKLISGLQQSLDVIGMSAQQAAEYKARLEGANEEQARQAGFWAGLIDTAKKLEGATREKDTAAIKGAQELLNKLAEQEVQLRMNRVYAAEYADLMALGVSATSAASAATWASELEGLKAQEEIVTRIKSITANIGKNTVPSLKKTGEAAKNLAGEIDNLVGSLFPAIKAESDWIKQQKLLDQALKKGKITQEQYTKGLAKLQEAYELIVFAAPEHVKALQDEAKSIKASIPSLRQRVDTFGLSAAAISRSAEAETKARIATLNNVKAVEVAKGASKEYVKQIDQEIEALKELLVQQEHQTGLLEEHERQESVQKYYQDMVDTAKHAHEEIERSLTDALMRGFESGKDFGRNFIDTLKNMFSSLVLRPIIQPIAAGAAGMVGFGGVANAATGMTGGGLGGFNLITGFAGSSAGLVQSIGGSLASINGSLGDFGANLIMNADKIGSALDMAGAGIAYGASIYQLTQGKWGSGLGGAAGQFLGGPIGSFIGGQLGGMLDKAFKGETRHGGGFVYDPTSRRAMYHSGPSGGYGGQQTLSAVESLFSSAADTIVHVFEGAGVDAGLAFFHGAFESSSKGRGGTFSGGEIVLADGAVIGFGGAKKGDGYGGKSGTAEEMFANLQAEVHFAALEAWKAVGTEMPQVIRDMLAGVDVRSLTAEQAQGLVAEISNTVGAVNALSDALNWMPMTNLRDLTFDATSALMQFAGGLDAITVGVSTYYQNFYTESERQIQSLMQMSTQLSSLNQSFPTTKQGFRELADSLDLSVESGQKLYAALMSMSDAAASFYEYVEQQAESSFTAISASISASHTEYISSLQSDLQAELQSIRDVHAARVKSIRDEHSQRTKVTRESIAAVNEKLRELSGISSSLTSGLATLRSQSEYAVQVYRETSLHTIDSALSAARAGQSLTSLSQLQDAISSVSKIDASNFTSLFDFELERAETVTRLKELEALTDGQIDVQELQLTSLNKQLESLDFWRDTQIQRIDAWRDVSIEKAQTRHDEALLRVQEHFDALLLDERERFDAHIAELLQQQANQLAINDSIEAGAASTAHGLSAVQAAIDASAARIASAVSSIRVDVSLGGQRLPAFADGGRYSGGLALVGEKGPEIINFANPGMVYTTAQSQKLLASAGSDPQIKQLLRQLIGSTGEMRIELRHAVLNLARMLGILDDVTQGGTELRTVVTNKKEVTA